MQRRWGMGLCAGALVLGAACAVNVAPYHEDEEPLDAGQSIVDAGAEEVDAGAEDAGVDAGPQRPVVPDAWGAPVAIAALNTADSESSPSMSGDMLRLCFNSDRPGGKGRDDIWCSFRDSVEDPWGPPANQGNLNTANAEWLPALSYDGSELYFSSDRQHTNQMNIYRAYWIAQVGGYGSVEKVAELNTADDVWSAAAVLSKDGLRVYFESYRSGGYGGSDLYVATRETLSSAFNTPLNLSALNSGDNDAAPGPSDDLEVMTFSSSRPGGATSNFWLWRSDLNSQGVWSAPVLLDIEGTSGFARMSNSRILPDGSLLFSGHEGSGKANLYIAPPKW